MPDGADLVLDLASALRRSIQKSPKPPSAEFEQSDLSAFAALEISPSDLVSIVNTAIRVGRGTETLKNLAAMLEPYGVRRKR